jgi:ABC-type nitrate/sulfonate/bicarbonate transport system permease component
MDDVFAYLLMLALFGLALFLTAQWIERRLLFWYVDID